MDETNGNAICEHAIRNYNGLLIFCTSIYRFINIQCVIRAKNVIIG